MRASPGLLIALATTLLPGCVSRGLPAVEDRASPTLAGPPPPRAVEQVAPAESAPAEGTAGLCLAAGRTASPAAGALAAAVDADPGRPEAYDALAAALVRAHRLDAALACLHTAVALGPPLATRHSTVARIERMRGRPGRAIEAWRRALELDPANGRDHARLAAALAQTGGLDAARRHHRRALELGARPAAQLDPLLAGRRPEAVRVTSRVARQGAAPSISAPVRLDLQGVHGAEVSIAAAGDRVVAAWIDEREPGASGSWRLAVAASRDGGLGWTTELLRPPGGAASLDFQGDPMTAVDPAGGTLWVGGADFGSGGQLYLSAWLAAEEAPREPVTARDGIDDKPLAAAGPLPNAASGTQLHVVSLLGLRSSGDLGESWSARPALGDHVGHVPRVDSAGRLYVVSWDFEDGVWLWRSLDGAATMEAPRRIATRLDFWDTQDGSRFPGRFRVPPLPAFTVDRSGRLFAVWADTTSTSAIGADVDLYVSRSTDHGLTWSAPRILRGGAGDQFMPWIEADAAGRLHLIWLDTRHTPQPDDGEHGMVDVYFATSEDAGESWTESRLTPEPFDSALAVWQVDGRQFLGDYLGIATSGERVWAAYPTTAGGDLDVMVRRIDFASGGSTTCDAAVALCLGGGRFAVEVTWEIPGGARGAGHPVELTDDSGYFWFFSATNVEQIVKVLDGCPVNGRKWVFASGLTNVRVVTTVTDTLTGEKRTYTNPQGSLFSPVADTSAFSTCP